MSNATYYYVRMTRMEYGTDKCTDKKIGAFKTLEEAISKLTEIGRDGGVEISGNDEAGHPFISIPQDRVLYWISATTEYCNAKSDSPARLTITYHTDANSRKGCHPVTLSTGKEKKGEKPSTIFLVDEPSAWFEDKWNCHVDGTDYPFKTKEECICWGLYVLGYLQYEK